MTRYVMGPLIVLVMLLNVSCVSGTYSIYPVTYSDGYAAKVAVYEPERTIFDRSFKWMVFVTGLGASGSARINYPQYRRLADAYGMALVGIDTIPSQPWFDTDLVPRHHLEEGIAFAKTKASLDSYLPCLYGVSMGGRKVLHELVFHPEKYSCFATSAGVSDMIQWDAEDHGIFNNAEWEPLMGGPTTSVDPAVSSRWIADAPVKLIGTADLKGRKLYAIHGTGDTVVPYDTQFIPLISTIPTANLAAALSAPGAPHKDFMQDDAYNSGYFEFFMQNALKAPPSP